MRRAPQVTVSPAERRELARWVRARDRLGRLAVRARIVLEAARGRPNSAIAARLGVAPETVARWRDRFRSAGLDGLRREAPRAGASARIPRELVEQVLNATIDRRGSIGSDWSTRSLARELRTNHMAIHRIWRTYGLVHGPPGPASASPTAQTRVDLVGTYRSARASAIVFGIDGPVHPRPRLSTAPAPPTLGEGRPPTADPLAVAGQLIAALRADEPVRTPAAGSGPSPSSLLVFLRSIEQNTTPRVRLDAIFDRPLSALGDRVAAWLEAHPRYRVFTTGTDEEWIRSTESWLRRWENVRLHPGSFRSVRAFRATRVGPAERNPRGEAARPAWRAGRSPLGRWSRGAPATGGA